VKRLLTFAIYAGLTAQASAQPAFTPPTLAPVTSPSITVKGDTAICHIKGDRTWSLHINDLNAYRAKHPGFKGKYCQLKSFEGREDITDTTAEGNKFLDWAFESSKPAMSVWAEHGMVSVGQGIYEKCDGTTGSVLTVVRTDMRPTPVKRDILYVREWDDVLPIYLFEPKGKGYIAAYSSCLNCGDFNEIHYNLKTHKVWTVYTGD
jgi:hypothetical protein